MKKPYTKPELERLLISSVEDILAGGSTETEGSWGENDDNTLTEDGVVTNPDKYE